MINEYIALHRCAYKEAKEKGIEKEWQKSHKENIRCAKTIEDLGWEDFYRKMEDESVLNDIVDEFGYERISYVLAYTMFQHQDELTEENALWACEYPFLLDDENADQEKHWEEFRINCDVDFINYFANDFILLSCDESPLLYADDCVIEDDYTGKIVAISTLCMQADYTFLEHQFHFVIYDFREKFGRMHCVSLYDKEPTDLEEHYLLGTVKNPPNWIKRRTKLFVEEAEKREALYNQGEKFPQEDDTSAKIVEEYQGYVLFLYKIQENNLVWFTGNWNSEENSLTEILPFKNHFELAKADFLFRSGKLKEENTVNLLEFDVMEDETSVK